MALVLVWTGDHASRTQWTVTVFVLGSWIALLVAMRDRLVRPLHAVSNMLEALREGDYSLRTRAPAKDDALGLILHEVNQLASSFHDQRLDALEASNLLTRVMTVIDVAMFAEERTCSDVRERPCSVSPRRSSASIRASLERPRGSWMSPSPMDSVAGSFAAGTSGGKDARTG